MLQASKKVDWCLKKAQKEILEKNTHRGLIKIAPDIKLAGKHIAKAEHNLNAALDFAKMGYSDWSPSAFFYSMYHCFLAILSKFGYQSRNQECTIATIEMLNEEGKIIIDKKFIATFKTEKDKGEFSTIELREDFQYGVEMEFKKKEEFEHLGSMCKELINVTKNICLGEM